MTALPELPPFTGGAADALRAERAAERAATGFCLVGHPAAHAAAALARAGAGTLLDALRAEPGQRVTVAATVRQVLEKRTRRDEWWATLWLEDAWTRCEGACFAQPWSRAFPAVLDGDGAKPDLDRVLLLTCARDREPGRLVVESADALESLATPSGQRAAELARLRDQLGDFVVVDLETCLGPPNQPGDLLGPAGAGLAAALAGAALGSPAARPGRARRGRRSAGATAAGGAAPARAAGPPARDPGGAGAGDGDWLARQRVVELGAVFFRRVRGRAPRRGDGVGSDGLVPQWQEFRRVSRLVDPGCPIDADSRRVHGIGDADVAGQPRFAVRSADLARVLGAWPTVVTYNGTRFDVPVLLREFARAGVAPPRTLATAHLDLAELAARRYAGRATRPASNKLGDQAAYWGVPLVGAHRADADAAATGQVLVKMVQAEWPG